MHRLPTLLLCVLLCLPVASGMASELPDLGDPARAAVTETQEAQIGRQVMRQIRADADYDDDPVLTEYLNTLGDRLVAASSAPYRQIDFFAVKDATINAFALPGGHIGVNTGLIAATRSESELAGVLSHEIGHVVQNHIARSVLGQKSSMMAALAGLAVAILASHADNPQAAEAAITASQAYSLQGQLTMTQLYEKEADRVGLQTLANAGFNPNGMPDFFKSMMTQDRLYDSNVPGFLRTHPMTYQRMADLQSRAAEMKYKVRPDSLDYPLIRARVMATTGDPQEAYKRFVAQDMPHADAAMLYGLALSAMRAGKVQQADQAYARLTRLEQSAMVDALGGEILLGTDRVERAVPLLKQSVDHHASYKPLAYAYVTSLLRSAKEAEAKAFIEDRQHLWPDDPVLFQLLAEVDQTMGRNAESHLAQAEAYARLGQSGQAIEQLQLARQAGDGGYYVQSVIDARLRDLKDQDARDRASAAPQ